MFPSWEGSGVGGFAGSWSGVRGKPRSLLVTAADEVNPSLRAEPSVTVGTKTAPILRQNRGELQFPLIFMGILNVGVVPGAVSAPAA